MLVVATAVGALIYSNTLNVGFIFDGYNQIYASAHVRSLDSVFHDAPLYRVLPYFSFYLNYLWTGYEPWSWHVVSIGFHIATSVAVYAFVRLLLGAPALDGTAAQRNSRVFAFCSSTIFLCHPIQTSAVTYLYQRMAVMAAFFYMVAIVLYLMGKLYSRRFYVLAFIAAVGAFLSKENAYTLPLMLLAIEFLFFAGRDKRLRLLGISLVTATICFAVYLATHYRTVLSVPESTFQDAIHLSPWTYFLTQTRVWMTYLRLAFFPIHQTFDYDFPLLSSIADSRVLLPIGFMGALAFVTIRSSVRHRLLSFAVVWFFLTLAIESSFIPIKDVIFEHRLYLPLVGFAIFVPALLFEILKNPRTVLIGSLAACALLGVATYKRNAVWTDEIAFWEDNIRKAPNKQRAYSVLGSIYLRQGRSLKAIDYFKKAVERAPRAGLLHYQLARAYGTIGDMQRESEHYLLAAKHGTDNAVALNGIGTYFLRLKKLDSALEFFLLSKKFGGNAETHNNIGLVYYLQGDYMRAELYYKKALETEPGYKVAEDNLKILQTHRNKPVKLEIVS